MAMGEDKVGTEALLQVLGIAQEQRGMLEKVAKIQQEQAILIRTLQQEVGTLKQKLGVTDDGVLCFA